jgi:23S rRNA (cytosine1962-C5)-methyltransferase
VTDSEYALLDLGDGRQLARFGAFVVDRPFPAAVERRRDAPAWDRADLLFERDPGGAGGDWQAVADGGAPTAWPMQHDGLVFELRPTPSGQVGFFAEQIEPWRWIRGAVGAAQGSVLDLFAYTGGSTLAAAAAGARVTHVDASRSAVAWARRNAELSGLAVAPIRWIVDDAIAFTTREARRGRRYQGVVLDPPSYGHGPHGERWTLGARLPELLDACLAVLDEPGFLLLTAHAEGLVANDLAVALEDAFLRTGRRAAAAAIEAAPLTLVARSGARAPAGVAVRWRSR